MKKFLTAILVASMLMVGSKASAQTWTAAGGYTTFSLMGSDVSGSFLEEIPAMPGFYFGVNYDYAFSAIDGLTVEPGAYFMHYGKEYSFGPAKRSYHANYVRVGGNMFSKGETYPGLKLFDAQWGVGVSALVADAVMFRVGYDFGLTRCIKDNSDLIATENIKAYRNTLYVGIGFAF